MINRSIPGYATIIHNIGSIAQRFAQPDTALYDMGCATGISSLSMARSVTTPNCTVFGIDNSAAMLEKCHAFIAAYQHQTPITLVHADVMDVELTPCSVVVFNFTLQFLPPATRTHMLQRVYDAMLPGGVLILSEKIRAEDSTHDELLIQLHHEFKRDNGYSELEISQKRTALENVMRLDTQATHLERLAKVGFTSSMEWYRCFNFMSLLAFKP